MSSRGFSAEQLFEEAAAQQALAAQSIGRVEGADLTQSEGAYGFVEIQLHLATTQVGAGGMHSGGPVARLRHHAVGQGGKRVGYAAHDGAAGVEPGGILPLVAQNEAVALQVLAHHQSQALQIRLPNITLIRLQKRALRTFLPFTKVTVQLRVTMHMQKL